MRTRAIPAAAPARAAVPPAAAEAPAKAGPPNPTTPARATTPRRIPRSAAAGASFPRRLRRRGTASSSASARPALPRRNPSSSAIPAFPRLRWTHPPGSALRMRMRRPISIRPIIRARAWAAAPSPSKRPTTTEPTRSGFSPAIPPRRRILTAAPSSASPWKGRS